MASSVVVVLVLLVVGAWVAGRWSASATPTSVEPGTTEPHLARELAERDAFIEQLRELAWQHRDVSPELSTIIIDEIATHHRRLSGPND
jgi:hypothetical protein